MDQREIIDTCRAHTLFTWAAQGALDPLAIVGGDGVYIHLADGKRLLDWNSQSMSVNIGHGNKRVHDAIKAQVDTLCYAYPGAATPVRARVGKKLADLLPDTLNTVLFTLGGADANENAVRAARLYSGKQKVLSRYRSYHGASGVTTQLTGDPRRIPNEPGAPGVIHVLDPEPYRFSFGDSPAERTAANLRYLEEVITYEDPRTIAAMIIEPVTGTNGVLFPPDGYLQGLRALLDKHGILLICDEVMTGFGRTGKLFGFEHGPIVPDIVTMAKGLTSSYAPLGAVALSDAIVAYFQDHVFWGGLTFNSHALSLAAAEAAIDVVLDEGMVENSARLGTLMYERLLDMKARHRSVGAVRGGHGLFAMIDLVKNARGEPTAPYGGSSPTMTTFAKFLRAEGLFAFSRWSHLLCCPPLCINEVELDEALGIIDRALAITDEAFED